MPIDLSKTLVIGISSRALFDLEESNRVFEAEGENAYSKYQEQRESEILQPGIAFRLVQAILGLNKKVRERGTRKAEVVVTSRNSPATSMRLFNSIQHHGLDIQRAILTSGTPIARYLKSFCIDLYFSAYENDVEEAIKAGIAAGVIYTGGTKGWPNGHTTCASQSSVFSSR
jgi:5'-nucleotidase